MILLSASIAVLLRHGDVDFLIDCVQPIIIQ